MGGKKCSVCMWLGPQLSVCIGEVSADGRKYSVFLWTGPQLSVCLCVTECSTECLFRKGVPTGCVHGIRNCSILSHNHG